MSEYIYILSNPSMPGLIKVGKTTTSPDQRMSELHSTGVPTPFVLEVSIEVTNCTVSERVAHHAILSSRVAENREFFRISVQDALRKILSRLGDHTIRKARSSHGIESIERELYNRRLEAERREAKRRETAARYDAELSRVIGLKRGELVHRIAVEQEKLVGLGPRPIQKELPGLFSWLWFVFCPIPIGWMFWFGALGIFDPKRDTTGLICICLIFAGWMAYLIEKSFRRDYERSNGSFAEVDKRIVELNEELNKLNVPSTQLQFLSQIALEPIA